MGLSVKDSGGGFVPIPSGVYPARCIGVIDLGTQIVHFDGEEKQQHKVLLQWEVFGEDEAGVPLTKEVNGHERPLTVSKRYTATLSAKGKLRPDLEAWRGRAFTKEELDGFKLAALLGAPCLLNITQAERDNRTYANVSSITPMPKGMPKPVSDTPLVSFDIDAPDVPSPELVLLEDCAECHVVAGRRCETWWGAMHGAWHLPRVEAARAKLPAP